ncbi:MAG TPA: DUF1360 domain-containing protein [Candidatus Paceibacterota bacterium]
MIRVTDQYFWNFVFAFFFFVLVVMGTIILEGEARLQWTELTLVDYALITLATWRLTQLFVYDSITKFFREQFWDLRKVGKNVVLQKPPFGPRRTLADLLSCPWCTSLFMAATVLFFYLLSSYAVFPVALLAIGAVASLFQLIANRLAAEPEK